MISEKEYYTIQQGDLLLVEKDGEEYTIFVIDPPTNKTFITLGRWLDNKPRLITRKNVQEIKMRRQELCKGCITKPCCNVGINGLYCYFERIRLYDNT